MVGLANASHGLRDLDIFALLGLIPVGTRLSWEILLEVAYYIAGLLSEEGLAKVKDDVRRRLSELPFDYDKALAVIEWLNGDDAFVSDSHKLSKIERVGRLYATGRQNHRMMWNPLAISPSTGKYYTTLRRIHFPKRIAQVTQQARATELNNRRLAPLREILQRVPPVVSRAVTAARRPVIDLTLPDGFQPSAAVDLTGDANISRDVSVRRDVSARRDILIDLTGGTDEVDEEDEDEDEVEAGEDNDEVEVDADNDEVEVVG